MVLNWVLVFTDVQSAPTVLADMGKKSHPHSCDNTDGKSIS